MLPNHQLARRIVALSLRANELANAIQLSKQHVSHIRLERQKALRQEKLNSSNRSKEQKKYYESIVARHQGFIEQVSSFHINFLRVQLHFARWEFKSNSVFLIRLSV